jgi:hypothetical protein
MAREIVDALQKTILGPAGAPASADIATPEVAPTSVAASLPLPRDHPLRKDAEKLFVAFVFCHFRRDEKSFGRWSARTWEGLIRQLSRFLQTKSSLLEVMVEVESLFEQFCRGQIVVNDLELMLKYHKLLKKLARE